MTSETTSPTVLIVEDDPDLAALYSTWLSEGYTVRTATSERDGLDLLDGSVAVVLLNRKIPDFSGRELRAEIQARGYDCRVAFVTGTQPDFDILHMEFDEYLLKPVTYEEMHSTVGELLSRRHDDEPTKEYLALLSKQTALQEAQNATTLATSTEYRALHRRLAMLEAELRKTNNLISTEDYRSLSTISGRDPS